MMMTHHCDVVDKWDCLFPIASTKGRGKLGAIVPFNYFKVSIVFNTRFQTKKFTLLNSRENNLLLPF